jgi:hypothetical protein
MASTIMAGGRTAGATIQILGAVSADTSPGHRDGTVHGAGEQDGRNGPVRDPRPVHFVLIAPASSEGVDAARREKLKPLGHSSRRSVPRG